MFGNFLLERLWKLSCFLVSEYSYYFGTALWLSLFWFRETCYSGGSESISWKGSSLLSSRSSWFSCSLFLWEEAMHSSNFFLKASTRLWDLLLNFEDLTLYWSRLMFLLALKSWFTSTMGAGSCTASGTFYFWIFFFAKFSCLAKMSPLYILFGVFSSWGDGGLITGHCFGGDCGGVFCFCSTGCSSYLGD